MLHSENAISDDITLPRLPNDTCSHRPAAELQKIPTAVWLDRSDAIKGGAANGGRLSLAQHLDTALAQAAAAGKPALVTIVVYDLPNRCRLYCVKA